MKRIGFIIFLIGLTLFLNFEMRGVWSANPSPGFPSEKGSIYAETHYLFLVRTSFTTVRKKDIKGNSLY